MPRFIAGSVFVMLVILLIVPGVIAQLLPQDPEQSHRMDVSNYEPLEVVDTHNSEYPLVTIKVYRSDRQLMERVPLEAYVRGVVASEMPHDFELEALKAQALAARTYILRRLITGDHSDTPEGSPVTDTVTHQVYQNEDDLRQRWGTDYERNISTINKAVNETVGQILTYEGQPIDATFFSTSNGYTENSEEYWDAQIPYLRSVESPWDKQAPTYTEVKTMPLEQFEQKMGIQLDQPVSQGEPISEVLTRTTGMRVDEMRVGGQTFSGKQIRELLELSSSDFDIQLQDTQVSINTTGYGHGVGMSQWGAQGMAQEGHQAEDIVTYYYQGIRIQDYRPWIVQK